MHMLENCIFECQAQCVCVSVCVRPYCVLFDKLLTNCRQATVIFVTLFPVTCTENAIHF